MPSKQSLLDDYNNSSEILKYAMQNHGVSSKLKFIKFEASGQVRVAACLESDHSHVFEGIGSDKKEAMADCISGEFPV